jgi:hypothetical protein
MLKRRSRFSSGVKFDVDVTSITFEAAVDIFKADFSVLPKQINTSEIKESSWKGYTLSRFQARREFEGKRV